VLHNSIVLFGGRGLKLNKKEKSTFKGLGLLASMGIALVVTTFLGLMVGIYLDRVFGTEPWLMIVFLILGVAAGFRNIYTTMKKYGF
jgi:ATP synthase protein I